jgi:hypothetical protein
MNSHQIPMIDGCIPGQLDLQQSHWILRHPNSKLFFIPFDPLTASTHGNPTMEAVTAQHIIIKM